MQEMHLNALARQERLHPHSMEGLQLRENERKNRVERLAAKGYPEYFVRRSMWYSIVQRMLSFSSLHHCILCFVLLYDMYPHTPHQGHWNIHELLEQNNGDWQFVLSSLKKMSPPVKEEVGDV